MSESQRPVSKRAVRIGDSSSPSQWSELVFLPPRRQTRRHHHRPKNVTFADIPRTFVPPSEHFVFKNGRRYHAYDQSEVPYPLSYDRELVDSDVVNHLFLMEANQSVTSVAEIRGGRRLHPKRCLDLGCGSGVWILDAAKEWPECHFVGFDLVPLQPKPASLRIPGVAQRIEWVVGNFLNKLPFGDGSFDHVHIRSIARGVPEDKWDSLFEEVCRVLSPRGTFELIEEDIIFPALPQPRAPITRPHRSFSASMSENKPSSSLITPPSTPPELPQAHRHILLESLFYGVFEKRFINLEPTSILESELNLHFRHVNSSPPVSFHLPPSLLSSSKSTHYTERSSSPPSFLSISDSASTVTARSPWTKSHSKESLVTVIQASEDENTTMSTIPLDQHESTATSLAMHLMWTAEGVLGCREAMFREMQRRRSKGERLEGLDLIFEHGEEEDMTDGEIFESLVAHFQRDVRERVALASLLDDSFAWKAHDEFGGGTKQNLFSEDFFWREPAAESVCRTLRVFCGSKG